MWWPTDSTFSESRLRIACEKAMRRFSFTRSKRNPVRARVFSERPSQHPAGPKNGPLTLAVAGTIALLVVLSVVSYRLIRDSSVSRKATEVRHTSEQGFCAPASSGRQSTSGGVSSSYVPPKVTFYRQLTQADGDSGGEGQAPGLTETDRKSQDCPQQAPPDSSQSEKSRRSEQLSASAKAPGGAQPLPDVSKVSNGPVMYTVQVGAFTDPAVAQQWAQKWKARGYKVTLRPVARPRSGVSYRLYLGKFSSQKKADDLVQRLKRKEGIRALRLLVRN